MHGMPTPRRTDVEAGAVAGNSFDDEDGAEAVLQSLLASYNAEPERRQAITAEIEARFRRPLAILVLDSSLFTRAAKTKATVHFLALLQRLARMVRPILEQHGGNIVVTEGDTIFSVFPDARSALAAALAIRARVGEDNATRPEPEQVACAMGIGFGDILAVGEHNIAGDEVNVAFKLGEDIAESGEILLTASAVASLIAPEPVMEPAEYHISGVVIQAHRICPPPLWL
jgi:adenylate cyclase